MGLRLSFCGNPISSKETEALHYSGTTFWVQTPPDIWGTNYTSFYKSAVMKSVTVYLILYELN